jgi:hypothetical protein
MEQARQALKKLNVFAQMRPKPTGNSMFSEARRDTLSDGIFGLTMPLLILDVRLPEDFPPGTAPNCCGALPACGRKFLPHVLQFRRARPALAGQYRGPHPRGYFNREYVNWWLLYYFRITRVLFTTIVVGRFVHARIALWALAAEFCRADDQGVQQAGGGA